MWGEEFRVSAEGLTSIYPSATSFGVGLRFADPFENPRSNFVDATKTTHEPERTHITYTDTQPTLPSGDNPLKLFGSVVLATAEKGHASVVACSLSPLATITEDQL